MPEKLPNTFLGHFAELTKRLKVVIFTFIIATIVMLVLPGNTDFFGLTGNYQPLMSVFLKAVREMNLPSDVQLNRNRKVVRGRQQCFSKFGRLVTDGIIEWMPDAPVPCFCSKIG